MDAAITAGNTIGSVATPKIPTKDDAYEYLVDLGTLLDENNTPIAGRFCIVPAWFHGSAVKGRPICPQRHRRRRPSADEWRGRRGAGFMIFKSNNVPNTAGTKYKIIAGHPIATSYAEQIVDVQTFKPEKRFGDAVKGLHVYGAKVLCAQNLAEFIANRS